MNYTVDEDCARALAVALMEICGHCFREEEQRDLYQEFYRASKEALGAFRALNQQALLEPSEN